MKPAWSFSSELTVYVLLLITLCSAFGYSMVYSWRYGLLLLPFMIYICYRLVAMNTQILHTFHDLVNTIRYRDFSRNFYTKNTRSYMQELCNASNEICDIVRTINSEKEIQYHYLHTIIELVDTGIISYEQKSGEVIWMNSALKNLLDIPFLKNFYAMNLRNPELYEHLLKMDHKKDVLLTFPIKADRRNVMVSSTLFITHGIHYRLLAFHDVNKLLDEAESKAWQRLLNVMTHEIMNSIAPISSLSGTLKNCITNIKRNNDDRTIDDLELGINTILRRSQGLLTFAETYRTLSQITELNIINFQVSDLFEHLYQLMEPTLLQKKIELDILLIDPLMNLTADISLVEQAIINLILNAIEAVKDASEPHIILSAAIHNEQKEIKVTDNGTGIPDDITDKIFIPFFTTRTNGNGIGLSLCKQIMMLHHGKIQMKTATGKGTSFALLF